MPKSKKPRTTTRFQPYTRRGSKAALGLDIAHAQEYVRLTGETPSAMKGRSRLFWITEAARHGAKDLVAQLCARRTRYTETLAAVEGMVRGNKPIIMEILAPILKDITDPAVRKHIQPWAQLARQRNLTQITRAFEDNGYPTTPSSKPIQFPFQNCSKIQNSNV